MTASLINNTCLRAEKNDKSGGREKGYVRAEDPSIRGVGEIFVLDNFREIRSVAFVHGSVDRWRTCSIAVLSLLSIFETSLNLLSRRSNFFWWKFWWTKVGFSLLNLKKWISLYIWSFLGN